MTTLCSLSDDAMLDRLQRAAFGYFTETMNPRNGLIPDTSRPHSPVLAMQTRDMMTERSPTPSSLIGSSFTFDSSSCTT